MLSKGFRSLVSRRVANSTRSFALPAHGPSGSLINPMLQKGTAEWKQLEEEANEIPSITLTKRHMCDIELLLNGGFSPLEGFMTQKDYDGVVKDMRLSNNTLWPMPITLDINDEQAHDLANARHVALKDGEGNNLAVMNVEDLWQPNKKAESLHVFGGDAEHPEIVNIKKAGNWYIGGALKGLRMPEHFDYNSIRKTPKELREEFEKEGWNKVVAFQTRNPMHRAHFELTLRALEDPELNLLVHPVVGQTKPGDIDHHTRVKCIREIMCRYPEDRATMSALPLAMRMAGPREAVWHAIIRKNYGATHFIVGRDHAGPGSNSQGEDFYGPYDARDFAVEHEEELGVKMLAFEMMKYVPDHDKFYPVNALPEGHDSMSLSGTEVRRRLGTGEDIPEWFSFGNVVDILRQTRRPKHNQGFTIMFTGLSGSGKTTVANALQDKLMELTTKTVHVLDGENVRQLLSSRLGFSKDDRVLNVQRIGFVASEITKAGGYVLAAPIAPYEESREFAKDLISENGGFMLVHMSAPLESCKDRDSKGLYEAAERGDLLHFTGVNDPYEVPENADLTLDTSEVGVQDAVEAIVSKLKTDGYLQ